MSGKIKNLNVEKKLGRIHRQRGKDNKASGPGGTDLSLFHMSVQRKKNVEWWAWD